MVQMVMMKHNRKKVRKKTNSQTVRPRSSPHQHITAQSLAPNKGVMRLQHKGDWGPRWDNQSIGVRPKPRLPLPHTDEDDLARHTFTCILFFLYYLLHCLLSLYYSPEKGSINGGKDT